MTENTDVVVIGGGYAGVMAANRLTQRDDVTVTLINPRPTFVERIRLHQLVGGSDDAVVDYRDVLAEGIRLVVDTVTRIDAAERSVTLASRRHGRLRLPDLRGGQWQRRPGRARSGRVRLPDRQPGGGAAAAVGPRRRARDGRGDGGRSRSDRHRDRRRAGGAGPHRDPGLRRGARAVPASAGSTLGGQAAGRARCDRARRPRREGDGGDPRCRAARRRPRAAERGDHLDRRIRRAGPGRPQRAEHRRPGPPAHGRDADQRGRRTHRRGRGLGGTVGPAVPDELPGRGAAGRARRRHGAQPDRG